MGTKASKRLVTGAQDTGGFLMESLSENICQKYRSTDIDDRQVLDEPQVLKFAAKNSV